MKTSFAIAALVATTLGLGSVLPALAQDAPPAAAARQWQNGPGHMMPGRGMGPGRMGPGRGMGGIGGAPGMGPAGLLLLACSDRGAEALEIALVHVSYRLHLSADQQKLFDTFRAKALTTETNFADTCKAARPAATGDARPDLLARLKAGLAVDQARLTALSDVLPDFEALYTSLSDTQKAALVPHHKAFGPGGMGKGRWSHRGGMPRPPRDGGPVAAPTNS